VEEASDAAARAVFDTNVFGILNVLRAVLPTLRAQRSGRIINLSSIGGFGGAAGWGIDCATKFAVEGFSEALAGEVGPLGIDVNHAQPGDPVKAAAAIVEIASAERPPLRIQLGRDAFTAVADKLRFVAEEQVAWRDLSVSTDHDDVVIS
jgi:NAD(P)-dependent dehydrogenase (short-subunit alcohol dehydrogenase family)